MHASSTVMRNVFETFSPERWYINLENSYKSFYVPSTGEIAMNKTGNSAIVNFKFMLVGENIHLQSFV